MTRHSLFVGSLFAAAILFASPAVAADAPAPPVTAPATALYGQIGRITAVAGKRDALIAILVDGTRAMPGCLSYIVAKDADDADAIWISEVWDSAQSHDAAFDLPAVQAAMTQGRPLIDKMDTGIVTVPVGGVGLAH